MTLPAPGKVLHRICPSCDKDVADERPTCPTCGSKLVEIRDEADALVGTVIDERFEVRAKLGQGGMGTVYRAWQRSVGREVAIKLIDRAFSRDPMGVRRFLREARLASQLSQPNTVSVFDFGQASDGRLFIAMELIRGRTLFQVMQAEGAFSIERTKRIGIQICDALEAAHGLGIVHRDLKLENVIVLDDPPGRDLLKVLDFGLAKNIRDPGSRATESGIVVGTPRYMSPEAAMNGTSLPAGDIYALGVILGELATGKELWDGESLPQLIAQKMDPGVVLPRIPSALRPTLKAMLEPEPDRRPTAPQARAMLGASTDEPGAGDTVLDPRDPSAGSTTNLRGKSDPLARTRQLEKAPSNRAPSLPSTAPAAPVPPIQSSPSLAEMVEVARRPARRVAIIAIAAALAVVVGAAIVFVQSRDGGAPSATSTAPRDAAAQLPAATPDATFFATVSDAGDTAVPQATIDSVPAGATVVIGSQRYKTPAGFEITQSVTATVMLDGYVTEKVTLSPAKAIHIVLKRKRKAPTGDEVPF